MTGLMLVIALGIGGLITYVDSRPTWDDTGITAFAILVTCGVLAALRPSRPWLWALAVGLWIPLVQIVRAGNYASLLALVMAFAGGYGGWVFRKALATR